jgi:ubiquinone/menaquinone biosynthesis C-methylase UbiE
MICRHGRMRLAGLVAAMVGLAALAIAGQDAVGEARLREDNRREALQRVPEILVALGALPGARVADVGAGDGFFSVRLARAVGPGGHVIAEDVDSEALDRLRARLADAALTNVEVVRGTLDDPQLPDGALDAILIVDAYHEMEDFAAMLEHVRHALKPEGRLVLVEPFDPRLLGESRQRQTKSHALSPSYAEQELRAAGFFVTALRDPFVSDEREEQWLMVAQPGRSRGAGRQSAGPSHPEPNGSNADAVTPDQPGTEVELASAELRVSEQQLVALLQAGTVVMLDIRGPDAYETGHIPGARLTPLLDLPDHLAELRRQARPFVAYCT